MITSLVITYSVSNHADNKLNHSTTPPADEVQAS
jgi:hypothetical protein